jgi:hypothetical protein
MYKHVQIIGILWIVLGVIGLGLGMLVLLVLLGASTIPGLTDLGDIAPEALRVIAVGVSSFLALLALPKIIAGIGLLRKREWARIMTLVLSFLELWSIPFGLALAVYSMVILFKPETIKLFNPAYQPPPVSS